jgi:hypothetical protein
MAFKDEFDDIIHEGDTVGIAEGYIAVNKDDPRAISRGTVTQFINRHLPFAKRTDGLAEYFHIRVTVNRGCMPVVDARGQLRTNHLLTIDRSSFVKKGTPILVAGNATPEKSLSSRFDRIFENEEE